MSDAPTGDLLVDHGWSSDWAERYATTVAALGVGAGAAPGRIVRHDGVAVMVVTADGVDQLPVRGSVDAPAVGDWVVVADGAVAGIVPRSSLLRRRDPDKDVEQVLAANVDLVGVVCGLDRPVKHGRIHRVALLAADAGVPAVVVLTKADLVDDPAAAVEVVRAGHPGLEVRAVDARGGSGIDAVAAAFTGRTVVLVGESGAGKSTLTNALAGEERAATGRVRGRDAKGRHTTTSREMHALPGGTVVIDSPGIRSVGVWVDEDTLADTFPDVEELAHRCRFSDCAHATEPDCAVTAAVADGTLAEARFDAWREMAAEVAASERGSRLGGPDANQRGRRP